MRIQILLLGLKGLICLDITQFVLLSCFILIETIDPKHWAKPLPKLAKSPFPVDVRCLKKHLHKLPNLKALISFTRFFSIWEV